MDDRSLEDLVAAARHGDADAFGQLVRRYQDVVFASAYGLVGDAHLAQDVAQEAFLQAYRDLGTLREAAAFPGWLRRIVFKFADRAKRGKRLPTVPLDNAWAAADSAPDPSSVAERHELHRAVQAELGRLTPRDRELIALHYGAGLPQQTIAAFLELPSTTVKKRLHDARRRLKERLMTSYLSDLSEQRPSRDERFARKVRFLVAVRSGDLPGVAQQLAADPELVGVTLAREEWGRPEMGQPMLLMEFDYTPLHFAAKYGLLELATVLLEHGAAVDDPTPGDTPLHVAILSGDAAMVDLLLEAGADPARPAARDLTPLHRAAMRGHAKIADTLIERGANPSARDASGRTPQEWALRRVELEAAARGASRLLETGIKVVDVCAPIVRGGTVFVRAGAGVGKLVLLAELTYRLAQQGGRAVYVGWRARYYDPNDMLVELRQMGVGGASSLVLGDDDVAGSLNTGLVRAEDWRAQGRDVLLVVDMPPSGMGWLDEMRPKLGQAGPGSITLIAYDLELPNREPRPRDDVDGRFDTTISLDVATAKLGVYPAVDPLASTSSLLASGELRAEHIRVARDVRRVLRSKDPQRARRVRLFGSQPFYVAEPWTARPGVSVAVADAVASYAMLLDDRGGDVSETQLMYVGGLSSRGE